jgi:iron complex transport system substrate-binding protein
LGHSEILIALVDTSRIAGIGKYTYDPDFSNVFEIAKTMPDKSITRDAESILSRDADLVIVSAFAPVEFIELLEAAEVTVVQTQFDDSIAAISDNVRLMAYILGEVERGERLVEQVENRVRFITDTVSAVPESQRPGVLLLGYMSKWTGGTGTSNEDTITLAGGTNLPSREFEGFQEIGDEAVFVMDPEIILLSSDEVRDNDALHLFLDNPALAQVDAIRNDHVYGVERRYMWNLSHWRVRGVEEVAKILYPEMFSGTEFSDFEIQSN